MTWRFSIGTKLVLWKNDGGDKELVRGLSSVISIIQSMRNFSVQVRGLAFYKEVQYGGA